MSGKSRTGGAGAGEWILNTIKQNPEGILLLAAGAVLMMRNSTSASEAPASGSVASAGALHTGNISSSPISSAATTVKEAASDIAAQTRDTVTSYASSASQYAGQARRAVGEGTERAVEQTRSAFQGAINRVVQDQPLAVALAGLAAGAAVAAVFPATDLERQALGPIGERASDAAEQVGAQLKQATVEAGQKLKSAAEDRGLNAEGLKEVASEVASTFSGTMSGQPGRRTGTGYAANEPATNSKFERKDLL
jgi:hypothetical protein